MHLGGVSTEKPLNVKVSSELHRALKTKASGKGKSLKEFVTPALNRLAGITEKEAK